MSVCYGLEMVHVLYEVYLATTDSQDEKKNSINRNIHGIEAARKKNFKTIQHHTKN